MHFHFIDERPSATPLSGVSWLLLGFVVISLTIHALFFIPGEQDRSLTLTPLGSPYIHVTLSNKTQPEADKKSTAEHTEKPRRKETASSAAAPPAPTKIIQKSITPTAKPQIPGAIQKTPQANEPQLRPSAATPKEADIPTNQPEKAPLVAVMSDMADNDHTDKSHSDKNEEQQREALHNYLLGELRDQLSRYLTYPRLARRRGWEGEVLLALDISTQGRLENIQMIHGSGYTSLDRSAIKSLSRIEKLHLPATTTLQQTISLQLPVVYRLSRE